MCSENKGTDQPQGQHAADLCLGFCICKKNRFSHDRLSLIGVIVWLDGVNGLVVQNVKNPWFKLCLKIEGMLCYVLVHIEIMYWNEFFFIKIK